MASPPPDDSGFGPMGGNTGEGMLNDPSTTTTMNNPNMNMNNSGMMNQQPSNGNNYGQQQQQYPPSTPEHRQGSITQFATPEHGVHVGNGAGMNSTMSGSGMMQSPQQPGMQQQQQPNMQASWQSGGGGGSPPPGSFAARSAQAYSNIPQQQQMQQPGMMGQSPGMMQQQQNYQQQQFQGNNNQSPMPPQQQQQYMQAPVPPGPQYRSHAMDASSPEMPAQVQQQQPPAGSFAARSAQAYGQQQQQPGMMPPQQQQPPQQPGMMQQPGQYQQQQPQPPGQQQQQQYPQQPASQFPSSAPQAPQQPNMASYSMGGASSVMTTPAVPSKPQPSWMETPAQVAVQNRLLTDATRKVQEHAYYMRQAIEKNDLPNVLDRASLMVGQLGEIHAPSHHHGPAGHPGPNAPPPGGEASQLNPKNYYELHMRALEDMPAFEEFLLSISGHGTATTEPVDPNRITITAGPTPPASPADAQFSMRELYDAAQYCPQVLPRLYLQICAGSALIQSGEVGTKWVMNDLMQATKCVQNPVRGLFLRHYLLQMIRDKLPDSAAETTPLAGDAALEEQHHTADAAAAGGDGTGVGDGASEPSEQDPGTVVDSYHFILSNFIEMNKLWVRIQHLPGDAKTKDQRKRRERQRNELRILVGTNLVRLSQLEGVTSKIYGEIILPTVLDHIVVCGDPLAQAYLIDCITQVFPDEYHIETLPILLRVCPKLRDKVNIRTILQSLMDRLANYLADEELLDETDTNQVKKNMAQDSFPMFEECVQNVYNSRGPKLNAKEVIRLQTALLSFSLRCFEGDMEQVNRCLQGCVAALKQANASFEFQEGTMAQVPGSMKPLDDAATAELEKMLSIPLDSLALKVLHLPDYKELLAFLPWSHRREVALKLLKAVDDAGTSPNSVKEIEELFSMVEAVIRDQNDMSQVMGGMQQMGLVMNGPTMEQRSAENALVAKLVHLLDNDDTDVVYEMLVVAREHLNQGGQVRAGQTLVAVAFATLRLAQRVYDTENGIKVDKVDKPAAKSDKPKVEEEAPASDEPKAEDKTDGDEKEAEGATEIEGEGEEKAEETAENPEATPASAKPKEDVPTATAEAVSKAKTVRYASCLRFFACLEPANILISSICLYLFPLSSCRKLFVFLQQTIAMVATSNVEIAFKLYLQAALAADQFAGPCKDRSEVLDQYGPMPFELISQAFVLYEQGITDTRVQQRCIVVIMGTLLDCCSLSDDDYQGLVTKVAQFSAKTVKKSDQCQLVAQCALLFYPAENADLTYRNAQRALECLQRALKLADACTSANSEDIYLFVDLLEHYLYFFDKKCPTISDAYVSGLVALIKEHLGNLGSSGNVSAVVSNSREQFNQIVFAIKEKREKEETKEQYSPINVE